MKLIVSKTLLILVAIVFSLAGCATSYAPSKSEGHHQETNEFLRLYHKSEHHKEGSK